VLEKVPGLFGFRALQRFGNLLNERGRDGFEVHALAKDAQQRALRLT